MSPKRLTIITYHQSTDSVTFLLSQQVKAGDHVFETSKDTTTNEYSASFLPNPSAQPTDLGVRAGDHIIETVTSPISLTPTAEPTPLGAPISASHNVPFAGDHITVATKDPIGVTPTAQPSAAGEAAGSHPPTEKERLEKAGRATEHYESKAREYVAGAQGTAQQYVASAQTAAQPYIEQGKLSSSRCSVFVKTVD